MEPKWSARAYREGDEEQIFELFKAVYPQRHYDWGRWLKWWHWMHKENPNGAARIWLAEHDGKIVGHRASMTMNLKGGDETLKAYQRIDSMTHPDYRHQGIYSALMKRSLEEAEKEGVHLTIGFGNEAVTSVSLKEGWFRIAAMPLAFKPLNLENALKMRISNRLLRKPLVIPGNLAVKTLYRAQKPPAIEGLTITQVSSFDDRIDELWAKVANSHPIIVVRNKEHLNWRYAPPDVDYTIYIAEKAGEVHGYLVLRCTQQEEIKVGRIFDIVGCSEEVIYCLVSQALAHCRQEKADLIHCNMLASRDYGRALSRNGFISLPFVRGAIFSAHSSSARVPKAFLKDPKNWFIQLGDSDEI